MPVYTSESESEEDGSLRPGSLAYRLRAYLRGNRGARSYQLVDTPSSASEVSEVAAPKTTLLQRIRNALLSKRAGHSSYTSYSYDSYSSSGSEQDECSDDDDSATSYEEREKKSSSSDQTTASTLPSSESPSQTRSFSRPTSFKVSVSEHARKAAYPRMTDRPAKTHLGRGAPRETGSLPSPKHRHSVISINDDRMRVINLPSSSEEQTTTTSTSRRPKTGSYVDPFSKVDRALFVKDDAEPKKMHPAVVTAGITIKEGHKESNNNLQLSVDCPDETRQQLTVTCTDEVEPGLDQQYQRGGRDEPVTSLNTANGAEELTTLVAPKTGWLPAKSQESILAVNEVSEPKPGPLEAEQWSFVWQNQPQAFQRPVTAQQDSTVIDIQQ